MVSCGACRPKLSCSLVRRHYRKNIINILGVQRIKITLITQLKQYFNIYSNEQIYKFLLTNSTVFWFADNNS